LLLEAGFRVIALGIVPTPTAQVIVQHLNCGGGIVITGSHNPPAWNALKFLGRAGIFWSQAQMRWLQELAEYELSPERRGGGWWGEMREATRLHLRHVLRVTDVALIRSRRWRVAVDVGNGAGGQILPELLRHLGCEVETLHGEIAGSFARLPEPAPGNLEALCARVREGKFDLGLACDADADRLALVHCAGAVGEEITLPLVAETVLGRGKGKLRRRVVVTNLSTSSLIEEVARRHAADIVRTPVGERYVVEEIAVQKAVLGGEGNGGVIYPPLHLGRDAVVAAALVLESLSRLGCSLRDWLAAYPPLFMHKEKYQLREQGELFEVVETLRRMLPRGRENFADGWYVRWPWGWLHLRISRTEPLLRVVLETDEKKKMQALRRVVKLILREHVPKRTNEDAGGKRAKLNFNNHGQNHRATFRLLEKEKS
jgi:phosphomannomutase